MSEVSQPNELIELLEKAAEGEGDQLNAAGWVIRPAIRALLEERNKYKRLFVNANVEMDSLRTELSAKDSALGDIADYQHRWSDSPITEVQKIARSILSQYKENEVIKSSVEFKRRSWEGDTHE